MRLSTAYFRSAPSSVTKSSIQIEGHRSHRYFVPGNPTLSSCFHRMSSQYILVVFQLRISQTGRLVAQIESLRCPFASVQRKLVRAYAQKENS